MGTNFYARHIPTEEEYAAMQAALTTRQLDKLKELIENAQKEYHIGKRSAGWQFLFSPRIDENSGKTVSPWNNTLESIRNYLAQPNVIIIDEYGQQFTPEQFWQEKVGDSLYNDPEKYINGEQYDKLYPERKVTWRRTEFTKDGLKFATTDDFT